MNRLIYFVGLILWVCFSVCWKGWVWLGCVCGGLCYCVVGFCSVLVQVYHGFFVEIVPNNAWDWPAKLLGCAWVVVLIFGLLFFIFMPCVCATLYVFGRDCLWVGMCIKYKHFLLWTKKDNFGFIQIFCLG